MLKGIEAALERLVEGTFSRAFKSELQPVELGKRLIKEIDSSRKLDVNSRPIAPNSFLFHLSPADYDSLSSIESSLVKELCSTARAYVRSEDLGFVGPVEVTFESEESVKVGLCKVYPTFDENMDEGSKSTCTLEALGGVVHDLYHRTMTIGRVNECDIVVADENVSRRHAEISPVGDTFEIVDLGSTNGIKINGERMPKAELIDGDEILIGPVQLWFRQ